MNIVLMDTRHHKTIYLESFGQTIIQPVETRKGIFEARFEYRGTLCGDPIYYQIGGPAIPRYWWGCRGVQFE